MNDAKATDQSPPGLPNLSTALPNLSTDPRNDPRYVLRCVPLALLSSPSRTHARTLSTRLAGLLWKGRVGSVGSKVLLIYTKIDTSRGTSRSVGGVVPNLSTAVPNLSILPIPPRQTLARPCQTHAGEALQNLIGDA